MFKFRILLHLVLVAVLLTVMIVPLVGFAGTLAAADSNSAQAGVAAGQPSAVIACIPGDPGTSGGSCGGG